LKKEKKALLTKIKTPTLNHPDEKSTKLASVSYEHIASNNKIKHILVIE